MEAILVKLSLTIHTVTATDSRPMSHWLEMNTYRYETLFWKTRLHLHDVHPLHIAEQTRQGSSILSPSTGLSKKQRAQHSSPHSTYRGR